MTNTIHFPVAACAGVADPAAAVYDNRWLVLDASGHWLSQSRCEQLADIQVQLRMGYLVLRAPGMLRLDIPLDVIEDDDSVLTVAVIGEQQVKVVDEGELASAWLTQFSGQSARLVKVHPEAGRVLWPDL